MKNKIFTIIVLFLFFIIFLFINPQYTGYTTYHQHVQPDIALTLLETEYDVDEALNGTIDITFNGPIKSDTEITLSIAENETKKTILEILYSLSKDYTIEPGGTVIANDETTKEIEYTVGGTKKLVTQIASPISELSFDIEGLPVDGTYPKSLTLDFLDDNIPDYVYLGSYSTYKSDKIKASSLDTVTPSHYAITQDHYYCELINLPYAQHFKINADYTGTGTVKAIILPTVVSGSSVMAFYLPNTCTMSSKSCEISLTTPIQGNNLVCIYTTSDDIQLDKEEQDLANSKGYKCDIQYLNQEGDSSLCTAQNLPASETRLGDFFITVQTPDYSGELKTKESFNIDTEIINLYLSICSDTPCTIPISVSSETKGKIKITNINIKYGSTTKDYLSEIIETQDILYEIENQQLTTLSIPLSMFDLTVPDIIQETETLTAKVILGEKSDQESIIAYKTITTTDTTLQTPLGTESALLSYTEQQKTIASLLGYDIDTAISQIENYNQQKQTILDSTTLTDVEKNTQIATIEQSIESVEQTVPTSIEIITSIKNLPTQRTAEIPDEYLLENQRSSSIKQQIINLQSNINIKTDVTVCELTINNVPEQKTLITKTISGVLTDIYLIEEIPKTIASSIDEIKFTTSNYEVIQPDPIIRWSVSSLPATITYLVPNDILDYYNELLTTAIPKQISAEPSEAYKKVKCGDGICTTPLEDKKTCPEDCMKKVNWWFVIILLALLIGGIYYLNFYRKKGKIIQTKPTLFRSKADENNLRNYIRKSLAHGIPKSRIKTILLAKGWSEKQLDYIINTL